MKGMVINDKGYIAYNSRYRVKQLRNRYKHRIVADEAIKEWNPFGWTELPSEMHVHHMDFCTLHYCRENLLILDPALHNGSAFTTMPRCPYTGRYVTRDEYSKLNGYDSQVPF